MRVGDDKGGAAGRIITTIVGFYITFMIAVMLLSSLIPPGESKGTVVSALSLVPAVLVAVKVWSRNK